MANYRPSVPIQIRKPCGESWEAMPGDSRVRHCGSCDRDVHNVAAMTSAQIEAMLAQPGPLPCIRLVRNEDGSLFTARVKQKPGLMQRASMALSTVMVMAASASAQTATQDKTATLTGNVVDTTGAPMDHATVELRSKGQLVVKTETDARGDFAMHAAEGDYTFVAASPGFITSKPKSVTLHAGLQQSGQPIALWVSSTLGQGVIVASDAVELPVETPLSEMLIAYSRDSTIGHKGDAVLQGRVVDSTGMVIPNVTVELRIPHSATKVAEAVTNASGEFRLISAPGSYSFAASATGFQRLDSLSVKLQAGVQQSQQPIRLSVGMAFTGIVVEVPMKTRKVKATPASR